MKTPNLLHSSTLKSVWHTLAVLTLITLGAQPLRAQAPLPIYEPFPISYTNINNGGLELPAGSGNVYPSTDLGRAPHDVLWVMGNSPGGGSARVVGGPAAMTYPGLYHDPGTPSVGLYIRTDNTTANRARGILFPTNDTGSVYVSFLLNMLTPPNPAGTQTPFNRLIAKLDAQSALGNNSGGNSMAGVWITTNNTLAVSKSSNNDYSAETASPIAAGAHLVVMRYQFNSEGDDEVALWLDPAESELAVSEGSIPAPALTTTIGGDVPSLSSFFIYHVGSEVVASMFLDEIRIANSWAEVTPTAPLCVAAGISTPPTDRTVNEGMAASFAVIAAGTSPTFQWQVSTDNGGNWQNVSTGLGANTPTYQTPPLTPADSGKQYRAIVNVACGGGSSATSTVATVTVVPAVITPVGVVVDDRFDDFEYNNLPYGISNSVWFHSTDSSLDASSGELIGFVPPSSTLWLGYYTDDLVTNLPVHLDVGRALRGVLVFKAGNIVSNNGALRVGFFSYADGGTRVQNNGFGGGSTGNGVNVRGYMAAINYGTNFTANPLSLYARNALGSGDLMGTTGNYLSLGGGPGGYAGAPAFQNDVPYEMEFLIKRQSVTSVEFTVTITGGGTNWTHTRVDNTYAYPRFDAIGFRAGNAQSAAPQFEFAQLLVEVIAAAPNSIPLSVSSANGNVTLTWSDPSFGLQAAPIVTGVYTNVPGATSGYTVPASQTQGYYRLIWPAP